MLIHLYTTSIYLFSIYIIYYLNQDDYSIIRLINFSASIIESICSSHLFIITIAHNICSN